MIDISTPAIWYPGQSCEDLFEELTLMLERSYMTKIFLEGKIDADTFLDFLAQQGYDPFELAENCSQTGC